MSKYRLVIEGHFDSAHFLNKYTGACARLHGHTWKVQVCVGGNELQENGILFDFKLIKQELNKFLDMLDHQCLNDLELFKDKMNPTAENLSRVLHEKISLVLPAGIEIIWVRVWESPTAYCEYDS